MRIVIVLALVLSALGYECKKYYSIQKHSCKIIFKILKEIDSWQKESEQLRYLQK
jgi:hypothetical protein